MAARYKKYELSWFDDFDGQRLTIEQIDEMFRDLYMDLVSNAQFPFEEVGDLLYYDENEEIQRLAIGAANTVLRTDGEVPEWASLDLTSDVTGTLPVGNGGTGIASYTIGDILYASAAAVLSKLAAVATGNALISGGVGAAPSWGKIGLTTHVSGTLPIANGGTNSTATPTDGGIVYGDGSAYQVTAQGSAGQVLTSNGASPPTWEDASGGGAGVQDGYWSPLTNGDGSSPELIFLADGDTVAVWTET
jgi:hypothetical protein